LQKDQFRCADVQTQQREEHIFNVFFTGSGIMPTRSHTRRILAACLLLVLSDAVMGGEIVECINSQRMITFRDVPCRAGEDALHIFAADGTPLDAKAKKVATSENQHAVNYAHPVIRIEKVAADHGLATDVATLKAAKEVLASMDRLSKLSHQQAFADTN
jgi:hypothetical protein